jgi:hypothetical protein
MTGVRKIFSSKKELLKHLGKNEKDVRLVDRMVAKGEVIKTEEGDYELVDMADVRKTVDKLLEEIVQLKTEKGKLEQKVADLELDKEIRESNEVSEAEYKEARVQWLYYADEYEKEKKDKEFRIRKCFQWIKARNPKANWEEFRDWVM